MCSGAQVFFFVPFFFAVSHGVHSGADAVLTCFTCDVFRCTCGF